MPMTVKPVHSISPPPVDTENQSPCQERQGEDTEDLNAYLASAARQLADSWKLRHPSAHVTDTTINP